ncbi:ATPase, P-type, K/Mg/Cd/Cu/Zn/Na/Ca/Na/H-transporter [Exidia glandulosa HHB12029]|uniref:ATPase, P-type, K/Mg/Cd/Cu/Zn/Na/Ca/Na/H-transporter n=1 Tax=Exidia glandulosa HHB12029 TaxID=1314781 RepID=A0A165IBP7_EXIGL|nr:ATPase, P-type, K/Mg/Cd/Cu/Zn/Na/Ca/Na/H-transporter [Exidia glandulosa HHB12029]
MEGPVFRELAEHEMKEVIPRLQVLARSSLCDKQIHVENLKAMGEIVAVTGDGANDGPALKTANVGFSMGIAGTEVAKEALDIILMDDNFVSIVSAIMWGRCINDAVRKFLQFQLSVNITAVIITFVTAVASGWESSVLSAVQLLWVNIIMDASAALTLATDLATRDLLNRKPDRKTAPLFTIDMSKQIIGQSVYSTAVVLVLHFAGNAIFGRLDGNLNVFKGILLNWYFMIITLNRAIMWGRCVNDAVRKFLQFQLSVNITAVIITFVTAVASGSESSVLLAVQLFWVYIIMDDIATDPQSPQPQTRP